VSSRESARAVAKARLDELLDLPVRILGLPVQSQLALLLQAPLPVLYEPA